MRSEEVLGKLLKESTLKIAAAESLTGGLFCKRLTDIPGSSKYFLGGIVAYSYFAKENLLHIGQEIIEKYGAVSKETAKLMAENTKSIFGADISISFTGVAGPEKQENKEVGTVFVGVCIMNKTYIFEKHFKGNRNEIRDKTVKFGINKIINLLGGKK